MDDLKQAEWLIKSLERRGRERVCGSGYLEIMVAELMTLQVMRCQNDSSLKVRPLSEVNRCVMRLNSLSAH